MPEWIEERRALPKLTAFVGYKLNESFPNPPSRPWRLSWGVDASTTNAICAAAVGWCAELSDAEVYLSQGFSHVLFDDPELPQVLAASLRYDPAGVSCACPQPLAVRS